MLFQKMSFWIRHLLLLQKRKTQRCSLKIVDSKMQEVLFGYRKNLMRICVLNFMPRNRMYLCSFDLRYHSCADVFCFYY